MLGLALLVVVTILVSCGIYGAWVKLVTTAQ